MTTDTSPQAAAPFDGGPPSRLEAWLRVRKPGDPRALRGAAIVGCVAWLPLAVLASVRGDFGQAGAAGPFLLDAAVHARYLVALPALILAEAVCIPRLGALARHFADSGLVAAADRPLFNAAIASTTRLRDSTAAEIAVIFMVYAIVVSLTYSVPKNLTSHWFLARDASLGGLTPAGWWHMLVSLPLLLTLILGWMWRVLLWARFLWLVSRLDLLLLPSHPDRVAGLRFAGHSLRIFALPAFGLSVIVAGTVINRILTDGVSLLSFRHLLVTLVLFVLLLFAAPLLVFSGKLLVHWQRGVLEYGTLANRVGQQFERGWLDRRRPFAEDPLEAQAFSATTDLYQVVANVYAMRIVPIDLSSLLLLVGATLLPFLPALLLSTPISKILQDLAGLLI